jgi:methyl-accepting chemotaxis protein
MAISDEEIRAAMKRISERADAVEGARQQLDVFAQQISSELEQLFREIDAVRHAIGRK